MFVPFNFEINPVMLIVIDVIPQTHYKRTADLLYNTNIPTTVADRAFLTQPLAINDLVAKVVLHSMAQKEPERNEGLSKAGFKIDPFGSLAYNLYERNGGHYMDVGASEKISQGLVCFSFMLKTSSC